MYSTDWLDRRGSGPYGELDLAVGWLLPKVHSVLLGPGMGRHPVVLAAAAKIVDIAKRLGVPVVLDADCLAMVVENPRSVWGLPLAVLTPNGNEFRLLCERMEMDTAAAVEGDKNMSSSSSPSATETAEAESEAATATRAAATAAGTPAAAAAAKSEAITRPTAATTSTAAATEGVGVGVRADSAVVAEATPTATTAAATSASAAAALAAAAAVGDGKGQLEGGGFTRRRETVKAAVMAAESLTAEEDQRVRKVERLAKFLGGVTVVSKGKVDIISDGVRTIACAVPGGLKRCGGIGDVLSGAMATSLAWVAIQTSEEEKRHDKEEVGHCTGGGRAWAYFSVACLSHLTIDHASLSRRSTVPTPNGDTSNI